MEDAAEPVATEPVMAEPVAEDAARLGEPVADPAAEPALLEEAEAELLLA